MACGLSAVGTAIGSLVHVGVKDGESFKAKLEVPL
ncbi:unnamed protein product [Allacma fusca]|uniref:Uncharacterized protein n=1 Tax=Allacma fusca TaxID=39272 RepID=A0A8J2JKC7_9HEXA|nr:unnamed protein product [Allacma fusca]